MTADPKVTVAHLRRVHFCVRGARAFAARYGLDWSRFVREGLPASELEATGDAMAARVCALARKEVK